MPFHDRPLSDVEFVAFDLETTGLFPVVNRIVEFGAVRFRLDGRVLGTLRQPKMLPPVEIRQALTAIVEVHLGATRDEVIVEAARLFGFRMTSAQLREVIEREVDWLVEHQGLDERNGKLYMKEIARLKV